MKKQFEPVQNMIDKYATSENLSKLQLTLRSWSRAAGKIMTIKKEDGSIDVKKAVAASADIIDGIAQFLPSPASTITGK